jgi:hypothetical protein
MPIASHGKTTPLVPSLLGQRRLEFKRGPSHFVDNHYKASAIEHHDQQLDDDIGQYFNDEFGIELGHLEVAAPYLRKYVMPHPLSETERGSHC